MQMQLTHAARVATLTTQVRKKNKKSFFCQFDADATHTRRLRGDADDAGAQRKSKSRFFVSLMQMLGS